MTGALVQMETAKGKFMRWRVGKADFRINNDRRVEGRSASRQDEGSPTHQTVARPEPTPWGVKIYQLATT